MGSGKTPIVRAIIIMAAQAAVSESVFVSLTWAPESVSSPPNILVKISGGFCQTDERFSRSRLVKNIISYPRLFYR